MKKLILLLLLSLSTVAFPQSTISISANDVVSHLGSDGLEIRVVRDNMFDRVVVRWPSGYGVTASDGRLVRGTPSGISGVSGVSTTLTGSQESERHETAITMWELDLGTTLGGRPYLSRKVEIGSVIATECVDGFWGPFTPPYGEEVMLCYNFGQGEIESGPLPIFLILADPRNMVLNGETMGEQCYAPPPAFGDFSTGGFTDLYSGDALDIILQSGAAVLPAPSCTQDYQCWNLDRDVQGVGDVYARAVFTFQPSSWANLTYDWVFDYPLDGSYAKIGSIRPRPQVDAGAAEGFCQHSGQRQLSALTSGGVWSDAGGYVSSNGMFDTGSAPAGDHVVSYEVTATFGCTNSDTKVVTVRELPAVTSQDAVVCANSGLVALSATPVGGVWRGSSYVSGNHFDSDAAPLGDYHLEYTFTTAHGCSASSPSVVHLVSSPSVDAGQDVGACLSAHTLPLSGGTPAEGAWLSPYVNGTTFNLDEAGVGVHAVTYAYTTDEGCYGEDARLVSVHANPVVDAGSDHHVCGGSSVTLMGHATGGEGPYSYSWSPDAHLDDPTSPHPEASPAASTTFSLHITDQQGCEDSATTHVEVLPAPTPLVTVDGIIRDSVTICKDDIVQLEAFGGSAYSWHPMEGLSDPYSHNPEASPTSTTTYTASVSDEQGCSAEARVTLAVEEVPPVDAGPLLELCVNDNSYDLRQDVSHEGGVFSGPGVEGVLFRPDEVSPGIYFVTYTIPFDGCPSLSVREVRVYGAPIAEVVDDQVAICPGGSSRLWASGGERYAWSPAVGLSDTTVASPVASPLSTTRYTVNVYNTYGCTTSTTVLVAVEAPDVDAGADFALCLNASPVALEAPDGGGTWHGPGIINGIFDPLSVGTGTFMVSYRLHTPTGCEATDSIAITVLDQPTLQAGSPVIMCSGDGPLNLMHDVNLPGGTFEGEGVTGHIFNPADVNGGTYIITYHVRYHGCDLEAFRQVTVHEPAPLDFGEAVTLCEDSPPYRLLDEVNLPGGTFTGDGVDGVFFDVSQIDVGSHIVTYHYTTAFGCVSSVSKAIHVVSPQGIDAGSDQYVCNAVRALDLSSLGNPTGGVYISPHVTDNIFDASLLAEGTYMVKYLHDDGNGCVGVDSLAIHVTESHITDLGVDSIVCMGSTVALNFSEALMSGDWAGAGVVDNLFVSTLAGEGRHVLTYSNDAAECQVVGTRTLTVTGNPAFATSEVGEVAACQGSYIELTASLPDHGEDSHTQVGWYHENAPAPFFRGSTLRYKVQGDERIYYRSISQFGCTSGQDSYISVLTNQPTATLAVSDSTPAYGRPTQFFAQEVTNAISYEWDFGDGQLSYAQDPWHFYYTSGPHTVTLSLTSSSGCTAERVDEQVVIVQEASKHPDTVTGTGSPTSGSLVLLGITPMPVSRHIALEMSSPFGGEHAIALIDIQGVEHPVASRFLLPGYNNLSLPLPSLAPGIYMLVIVPQGNHDRVLKKVFVK